MEANRAVVRLMVLGLSWGEAEALVDWAGMESASIVANALAVGCDVELVRAALEHAPDGEALMQLLWGAAVYTLTVQVRAAMDGLREALAPVIAALQELWAAVEAVVEGAREEALWRRRACRAPRRAGLAPVRASARADWHWSPLYGVRPR